jgi:hypothetical protein
MGVPDIPFVSKQGKCISEYENSYTFAEKLEILQIAYDFSYRITSK